MPPADEARLRGLQLTGCGLNPLLCLLPSACEKLGEYGTRRACGTGRSGRTGNSSSHSHASRYASRTSGYSGRPTGAHRPYPTASGSRRPVSRLASWPSSRPSHSAVSKPSHSSNYTNYSLTASPKLTAAISSWYVPKPSSASIVRNCPNSVPAIAKNQEPGKSTSTKSHGRDRCDKTCTGIFLGSFLSITVLLGLGFLCVGEKGLEPRERSSPGLHKMSLPMCLAAPPAPQ